MSRFISARDGDWRLWYLVDRWTPELWRAVRMRLGSEAPARHPRTLEIGGAEGRLFLKLFFAASGAAACKDFFRSSRAVRFLRQTERLAALGFDVPRTAAAGEERRFQVLRRSFVATLPLDGRPLPQFLRDCFASPAAPAKPTRKRETLIQLARTIRRLHDCGFVHGDLVPGNILVTVSGEEPSCRFYFMDNDRTRRYPPWMTAHLRRRNLVQLNRFPLPGITLQDRVRFFKAYAGRRRCTAGDRRLLGWLERKTRQRRRQCDGVEPSGSFRRLMRWEAGGS